MNKSIEEKQKVIESLLDRFPDTPTATLAKKAFNENGLLFSSINNARCMIRYRRGTMGKKNRKQIAKDKQKYVTNNHKDFFKKDNPFNLPPSEAESNEPHLLPLSIRRMLLLSDIHFPYQDNKALTLALRYGMEKEVDTIYLNGDTIDFFQISRFIGDPRKPSIAHELDIVRNFLDTLRENFPNAKIYYKIGNHDVRLETYLFNKAPELLECTEFKLENLLQFGSRGITPISSKKIAKCGRLFILHGHEFVTSSFSPVNPARGFYMKAKANMIGGHHHQTSEHTENNLKQEPVTCWSTGCLCELTPDYMPINKWNHGFAYIEFKKDGSFKVENKRIIKGEIR